MKKELNKIYENRKESFKTDLKGVKKHSKMLETFRLVIFLIATGLLGYSFYSQRFIFVLYAIPVLLIFLILVAKHSKIKEKMDYLQNIIQINETALLRLNGKWNSFKELGEEFINLDHPYSTDLNIFGQGSLFQYFTATTTFMGKQSLADKLMGENKFEEILHRQQSVKELANDIEWRQSFQALGLGFDSKKENTLKLLEWAKNKSNSNLKHISYIFILPVVTLSSFVLYLLQLLPLLYPLLLIVVQTIIVTVSNKYISSGFQGADKTIYDLSRYSSLLKSIEDKQFKVPFLIKLQKKIIGETSKSSHQIAELAKIVDRINLRYYQPLIYFPINILTFWDLYTFKKLENWKSKYGLTLKKWFWAIGEFEALSSLAGLAYDNPDWAFPEVNNGPPIFEAVSLGHPLIYKEERVNNDASLLRPGTTLIITGSNMSGKSTYLRTIGINLVLAYTGAPVCSEKMKSSFLKIYSKMQILDDLEQKTSTFYAELKRIKMIIDASQEENHIIFLLDEIFRGTNSKDRIFGTKMVIRNVSKPSTMGLLTTHDLELASLEKELPGYLKNFHFADKIYDGKINFDYKLRPGVSRSTNAVALMKMIGIKVDY